jgi:hypothetical protein
VDKNVSKKIHRCYVDVSTKSINMNPEKMSVYTYTYHVWNKTRELTKLNTEHAIEDIIDELP